MSEGDDAGSDEGDDDGDEGAPAGGDMEMRGEESRTRARTRSRRPTRWSSATDERSPSDDASDSAHAARRPPQLGADAPATDYKAFTTRFDEIVEADDLCDDEELGRLRAYLDQQMGELAERRHPARQPAAAAADGAAGAQLGLRPGRRAARRRAAGPGDRQPGPFAELQGRARHRVSRTPSSALLIDNSGSMRGRPIAIAAICADILARTLERCGVASRDPRLHHPRLEGRAEPRGVAGRRPAAAPGPAQRPAPHRLQARRRALPPRAPQPRADDARGAAQGEYRRRGAAVGAPAADRAARGAAHPDGHFATARRSTIRPPRPMAAPISSGTCAR